MGPGVFLIDSDQALGVRIQAIDDDDFIALIRELEPICALSYLYLAENRKLTNRGLRALAALPQLRYLNISSCDVTSEGLAFLPELTNLETLDISYCNRLTGTCGRYIQKLPKLKTLLVQGTTKLNTADLKRLSRRRLEIKTGKV